METVPAEVGRAGPIWAGVEKVQLFSPLPSLPPHLQSHGPSADF